MAAPIGILTNIGSLSAQRNLAHTARALTQSIGRLSSGLRVRSAADDAAGLAVSENLGAQIRGYQQAQRNANDAIAIIQTAESAYDAISDILVRMRELAVESANESLTDTERAYTDTEFQDLISEIDRISNATEYNGIKLLDGTAGSVAGQLTFQIGTRNTANDRLTVAFGDMDAAALSVDALSVDTLANSQAAITAIDTALATLSTSRASLGAAINRLNSVVDQLGVTVENLSTANAQIRDVDIASESANFTQQQVLMNAGVAMLAQANATPNFALQLLQ